MASSGNFCTWNAVMAASNFTGTLSIGNTKSQPTSDCTGFGTMAMTTGKKWYFEARAGAMSGGSSMIGIMKLSDTHSISNYNTYQHSNTNLADAYYVASGDRILNGSGSTVGGSYSENDVIGVAVDLESSTNTITFYKNNSGQGSLNLTGTGIDYVPSLIRVPNAGGFIGNWGQDSTFGGAVTAGGNADANGFGDFLYSVPSGHLAICSANLGISDDIDPAQTDDDYPGKNFNTVIYTGNGSTQSITGLGFKPDLVWLKRRDGTKANALFDSNRGVTKYLSSDSQGTGATDTSTLTTFGTDGFSLASPAANNLVNGNGFTYVGWCWKANGGTTSSDSSGDITVTRQSNTKGGFAILTYTGNGSADQTIAHGLGATPAFIITKNTSSNSHWAVWHHRYTGYYGQLEDTGTCASDSSQFYTDGMTSNFIGVKGSGATNDSGSSMLGYVWTEIEGYSKFGTFEGNANNDGPFIYTGFRPRMVFIKSVDTTAPWLVWDTARNTFNPANKGLAWNDSAAESDYTGYPADILSNGFKLRSSNATINASGTWIYGAWGDVPFKYNNTF